MLLSDDGHFDNFGLYEMVLRRCRFIIVVDGSQDENANFDDLGATVRKIRIDFGVRSPSRPGSRSTRKIAGRSRRIAGRSRRTVAPIAQSGRFVIPPTRVPPNGMLFYIKPTIPGDELRDVLQYAPANPAFPHQPTTDQFFDEPQFES